MTAVVATIERSPSGGGHAWHMTVGARRRYIQQHTEDQALRAFTWLLYAAGATKGEIVTTEAMARKELKRVRRVELVVEIQSTTTTKGS